MKPFDKDSKDKIFLIQIHNFMLKYDPCMSHWRRRYAIRALDNEEEFGEWTLNQIRNQINLGQIPPNRKYDIALGPHSKVKFFAHM